MKNSNDTIGNRTRDLPACSAMPQPTAPPRAPYMKLYCGILWHTMAYCQSESRETQNTGCLDVHQTSHAGEGNCCKYIRDLCRTFIKLHSLYMQAAIAQSLQRLAMGWTVRGSNPVWGRVFPHPSRPVLGTNQTSVQWVPGVFPGSKVVGALTIHPNIAPRLKKV